MKTVQLGVHRKFYCKYKIAYVPRLQQEMDFITCG